MLLTGGSVLAESQDWPNRAVWYQIFPERFRNGDPKNDPTAEYSRVPEKIQALWGIIPWTKEWYALTPWEKDWARDVYGTNALRRYGGDPPPGLSRPLNRGPHPVAPLRPGTVVVAHFLKAQQIAQHKPSVAGSLPDPAVSHHLLVG